MEIFILYCRDFALGAGHYLWSGRAEEIDILRENLSRPTRPADKTFRGPLDIVQ